MAGFTDHPFRAMCVKYGADVVVSEMISAKAMHFKDKKTATLARIYEGEGIFGAQIFGSEPEIMAEAALALIPYLVDLVVVVIGVASMLAIAVILLVRNLKAETLPGDELCDLDHVEEEDEFLTEAEMLARQEAEAAKAE